MKKKKKKSMIRQFTGSNFLLSAQKSYRKQITQNSTIYFDKENLNSTNILSILFEF
jgi:hypothetical protein